MARAVPPKAPEAVNLRLDPKMTFVAVLSCAVLSLSLLTPVHGSVADTVMARNGTAGAAFDAPATGTTGSNGLTVMEEHFDVLSDIVAQANESSHSSAFAALEAGAAGGGLTWFAEVCRAMNCGGPMPGVQQVQHFDAGGSAAAVGRKGGDCIVAFRGTHNIAGVIQDVESLVLVPVPGCPGCEVGTGILSGYNSLAGPIKGALRGLGCSAVTVTGHSLGAAEAVVAMYDLPQSGFHLNRGCTFGQPRVGNPAFHEAWQRAVGGAPVDRVVHGLDPIVPLGPVGSNTHEGREIFEPGFNVFTDHLYYAGVGLDCL